MARAPDLAEFSLGNEEAEARQIRRLSSKLLTVLESLDEHSSEGITEMDKAYRTIHACQAIQRLYPDMKAKDNLSNLICQALIDTLTAFPLKTWA